MKQNHTVGTLTLIHIKKNEERNIFQGQKHCVEVELILNLERTQFDDTSYWIILF